MHELLHVFQDDRFENHCLLELEGWQDFDRVLEALAVMEGVERAGVLLEGPYSRYIELRYGSLFFTLMYHEDLGVCFRVAKNRSDSDAQQLTAMARAVLLRLSAAKERGGKQG